jgi:hypothetical protein
VPSTSLRFEFRIWSFGFVSDFVLRSCLLTVAGEPEARFNRRNAV